MAELKAQVAALTDDVALLRRTETHQRDTLRREFEDRHRVAVREHELKMSTQIKVCTQALCSGFCSCQGVIGLASDHHAYCEKTAKYGIGSQLQDLVMLGRTSLQCPAAYAAVARDALPLLILPQELQIQLEHACAPAEQLRKQVRSTEQAAAAREARLEERCREHTELAARQATQALQALRAQLTAAHAEALLDVSCHRTHTRPRLELLLAFAFVRV